MKILDEKYPFVSLIISNYNGKNDLKNCLASLNKLKYKGSYEIIVVDSGSIDGSPNMVKKKFPDVKLIKKGKIGIGEAINIGIKSAKGDIIGFDLNNDEIFSEDWLQILVDAIISDNSIGVVGGIRLLYGTRNIIDEAGITYNYLGIPSSNIRSNYFNFKKDPVEVDYVGTIIFRKNILKKIGMVDETYYIYGEDADFCARIKALGYKILLIPNAISYHKRSQTLGTKSPIYSYYNTRAKIRYIMINFSLFRMIMALFWWMLLMSVIRITMMIFPIFSKLLKYYNTRLSFLSKENSKENFRAFISAISWNIRGMKCTFKRRIFVKENLVRFKSGSVKI